MRFTETHCTLFTRRQTGKLVSPPVWDALGLHGLKNSNGDRRWSSHTDGLCTDWPCSRAGSVHPFIDGLWQLRGGEGHARGFTRRGTVLPRQRDIKTQVFLADFSSASRGGAFCDQRPRRLGRKGRGVGRCGEGGSPRGRACFNPSFSTRNASAGHAELAIARCLHWFRHDVRRDPGGRLLR